MKQKSIKVTPIEKNIEKYLTHLNDIFQAKPILSTYESGIDGIEGMTSIIYENTPEKGMITGITYGLSLTEYDKSKNERSELIISVKSEDTAWVESIVLLASQLRGDCPFTYGDVINFRERISMESNMDAFCIFVPSTLEKEQFLGIDIGTDYSINLRGIYPIYASEIRVINRIGAEKFWHHPEFDKHNVARKRIEK